MIGRLLILVLNFSILFTTASILNQPSQKSILDRVTRELKPSIHSETNLTTNRSNRSLIYFVNLQDDHEHLTVHWAGKNSPVIICLAKNRPETKRNQSSAVHISYNYGQTFEKISTVFKLENGSHAIIETFYISPVLNSYYLFMDRINQHIFITKDFGKNFQRIHLPFVPQKFQLHHTIPNLVLAQSIETDRDPKLYLSENFGLSWRKIQDQVGYFSWSVPSVDIELRTIFVQRLDPESISSLISSSDFFADPENTETWLTHCEKIDIRKRFIFVACRFNLFGFRTDIPTYQLWISEDRKPFHRALFATNLEAINYHVADMNDDCIFLAVTFNDSTTNLYTSNSHSFHLFTLSLENIVFYHPIVSKKLPGINYEVIKDQEFADLHPVAGIRGTYIVSKWKNNTRKSISDIITLITYDFGHRWHRLKPPSVDVFGHPIACNMTNNCSLHLVQRFMSMSTNSKPILSRESSVGYILATGVIGSSLKGKQNIFLSIDAGNTWHHILSGNFLYAFGDHGSIIVAVEHFSKAGPVNELYYSIDDGYTFEVLKFHPEKIRVYGLLMEPGEKHSVFTIFGSKKDVHQWIIIQVNFTETFEFQCQMPQDYKEWSPHDYESKCLLGSTQIYMRRMSSKKCYNGNDFFRPVSYLNCPCKQSDYECDHGYELVSKSIGSRCEPISLYGPAQKVPNDCEPGHFFNKTQGYRKLPGDTCEGGEEELFSPHLIPCPLNDDNHFILFVQRQEISMIHLNDWNFTKHPLLPKSFLSNAIAADFDVKNKCLYWSDIHINRILKYCFDGKQLQPELFVNFGLDSVEGIVFNQINGHLYFVNGNNSKVEVIDTRINYEGRMRRTILSQPDTKKPRGIALDPINCYLFITDWSVTSAIIRSDLDGENVKVLFNSNVVTWPNGITVDLETKRIFWVDAKRDYIASAQYDGTDFKYLLQGDQTPHPFALAVYKNLVFYDDWQLKKLVLVNKQNVTVRKAILEDISSGMDLKIVSNLYPNHENSCNHNHTCSHLCIAKPYNSFRCLCPDGFVVEKMPDGNEKCSCSADRELTKTGACRPVLSNTTCSSHEFQCDNGNCVSRYWKCDYDDDCGDGSDEKHCHDEQCKPKEFRCKSSGKCIQDEWICNHEKDCEDGSDEDLEICATLYPSCDQPDRFLCQNRRCIDKKYVCDFIDHCLDGSDEMDCFYNSTQDLANMTCEESHFKCDNGDCIQRWWRCDGYFDCLDKSDEDNCQNECTDREFSCPHNVCIDKQWVCDNDKDCIDGSDELNCDYNNSLSNLNSIINGIDLNELNHHEHLNNFCPKDWFHCKMGNFCIPSEWFCDGNNDCSDSSDELQCSEKKTVAESKPPEDTIKHDDCGENRFSCYKSNHCIFSIFVCDGSYDCAEGEDEANCKYDIRPKCPNNYFSCLLTLGCIPTRKVCDTTKDCFDGSDEWGCLNSKVAVNSICLGFQCRTGDGCIETHKRCDREFDCKDASDEMDCDDRPPNPDLKLFVQYDSITSDEFTVFWTVPETNRSYVFRPSFVNETHVMNASWTTARNFTFSHLHPGSTHQVMIYSKFADEDLVLRSNPIKVTTESLLPNPPENLTASIFDFNKVRLKWSATRLSEEPIKGYRVYQSPPDPPLTTECRENHLELCCFQAGINYTFWVTTLTKNLESYKSEVVPVSISLIATVKDLAPKNVTDTTVRLGWKSYPRNITKWLIVYTCEDYFPAFKQNITVEKQEAIIENLSPGVNYQFRLFPLIEDGFRTEGIEDNVISVRTLGAQLPSLDVQYEVIGSRIWLWWPPPSGYLNISNIGWEYAIYMGDKAKNIRLYAQTKDTKIVLLNLFSCQYYSIEVRVVQPFGIGPAPQKELKILTKFDTTSPPRDIQIRASNTDRTEYMISWNSSCPEMLEQKIGYIVSVYDLIHKRLDRFRFKPNNDTYHSFTLSIHYGAIYEIKISTTGQDSRWSETMVLNAPPMPIVPKPYAYIDDNERINIVWKTIDNYPKDYQQHRLQYKVYVHNGQDVMNGEFVQTNEPPAIFEPKVKSDLYYIGISLIDNHGYSGPLSETYHLYADDLTSSLKSSSTTSSSQYFFILGTKEIFLTLMMFFLAILFTLMAVKKFYLHRKPTVPIISSHYNSRSESAILTSYDHNDEDNRAFSDDESLVLA